MPTVSGATGELVRLHADDSGRVWFGDGDRVAVDSGSDAATFLSSDVARVVAGASRVRVLGTRANAGLIVALHQHKARAPGFRPKVQIGSPALLSTEGRRHEPAAVLQQLWHPGAGMWHDMREADFCSYAIASELPESGPVPEVVRRTAVYHPAWLALSFVRGLCVDSACRLLAEILDPRWYRHPNRPSRPGKLYAHLGLTPGNMRAYLDEGPAGRHYGRAELVLRTWSHSSPHCFLWRHTDLYAERARGLLRASQRLISFVREVWLYAVAPPHPEVSFDPALFFHDDADALAFVRHRAAWKPV